jgi:hypothetical protein
LIQFKNNNNEMAIVFVAVKKSLANDGENGENEIKNGIVESNEKLVLVWVIKKGRNDDFFRQRKKKFQIFDILKI